MKQERRSNERGNGRLNKRRHFFNLACAASCHWFPLSYKTRQDKARQDKTRQECVWRPTRLKLESAHSPTALCHPRYPRRRNFIECRPLSVIRSVAGANLVRWPSCRIPKRINDENNAPRLIRIIRNASCICWRTDPLLPLNRSGKQTCARLLYRRQSKMSQLASV